jgi:sulfite exporter TauE/SafE
MGEAFALTALLMGLAGGSHCLVMCAAPCRGVITAGRADPVLLKPATELCTSATGAFSSGVAFHAGRTLGYTSLGALAAFAMESLAWITQSAWSIRPLWTFAHVCMLIWGAMLLLQARQPVWVERAGRAVWQKVSPIVHRPGGVFLIGALWALMPCGLLYSALLVSALSASVMQGAVSMLCFALGSGVWLIAGPWVWGVASAKLNVWRAQWGTRAAGGLLLGMAAWAIWMDLVYKPSLWCR